MFFQSLTHVAIIFSFLCPVASFDDSDCNLYKECGVNNLSPLDIIVKSESEKLLCIKAKFRLEIKVDEVTTATPINWSGEFRNKTSSHKVTLGYVPLDSIVHTHKSCPELTKKEDPTKDTDQTLLMDIEFKCGRMKFTFKRDAKFYLSSIEGMIQLDLKPFEFSADESMFFTSDTDHHFKTKGLAEVSLKTKSQQDIDLTANFYDLEFEVFRNTTSNYDYILEEDKDSQVYKD